MKKIFTKLGIVLIASATILPLTACTFNFYINRVTNSIAKSFADQTSALIKSMVMSKELDSDTSGTNDDIMGQIKNSSINNLTKNTALDNWGALQSRWGENGNIDIKGFNPDEFFKVSGTGQLTKDINSKNNINSIFSNLNYVRTISIMSNRELSNIIKGTGFNPISTFLKTLQGNLSDKPAALQLLINLINNYGPNFLTPLNNIFNNLINGSWSDNQVTTPNNLEELTTFMTNWKDDSDQPYSAWNDGTKWIMNPKIFIGHKVTEWKAKEDYDLYRGGTLINYLFWKISKDHNIVGEKNKNPRYLGEIVEEHINGIDFDDKAFLVDIRQYVPFLITNPLYILMIVEALIPVIKKWILEMPDITEGVKYLTIGNGYPSNSTTGSYNLLNIANTIKSLLNNPDKLREILKITFGRPPTDNPGFDTFLYDVKVKVTFVLRITTSIGALFFSNEISPDRLINPIMEVINNDSVKSTINDVVALLTEISKEYPSNEGINIDLEKLKTFLLNNETGLLVILENDTIVVLKKIIKQPDVTSDDVDELYKSLGGHVNQEDPDFPIFTSGSILDILQKTMLQQDSELNKILNLVLGTTDDENHKSGIANIITANNNKWIKDNYNAYFDANNTAGINKKIANTYNITMTKSTTNNIETINLKYDFVYKINNKTYHFIITAINIENLTDFQGIRTFKFKSISLVT